MRQVQMGPDEWDREWRTMMEDMYNIEMLQHSGILKKRIIIDRLETKMEHS